MTLEDLTTSYAQAGKRWTSRLGDVWRQASRVVVPVIVLGVDEADATRATFIARAQVSGAPGLQSALCMETTRDAQVTARVLALGAGTRASVFISNLAVSLPNSGPSDVLLFQWANAANGVAQNRARSGHSSIVGGGSTPRLKIDEALGPFLVRSGLQVCIVHDSPNELLEAELLWREL
jgi:hypothetical protein